MHLDPLPPKLVGVILVVLAFGFVLRLLRQPYVIGHLLAGVLLGPHGLGWITDQVATEHLGAIGVVILLFFVGMEVSLPRLIERWRVALIGTALQIGGSLLFVACLGAVFDWSVARVVLLGFVISLSSTAVVIKLLQDWGEMESRAGQDVLAVLLAQDLALVPMLLVVQLLGAGEVDVGALAVQLGGGVVLVGALAWLLSRDEIPLPLGRALRDDHELQVFAALILCFGLALLTGLLGLSTALGAFAAGIVVTKARETHWVTERLESFRVVFVALFFFSIGMLIDLPFLRANLAVVLLLLSGVILTNTLLNAGILRWLGDDWRRSLYAGALLSQVGEFSFVLAAVGLTGGMVTEYVYQTTVAVIALSLISAPVWIALVKRVARPADGLGGSAQFPRPASGEPPPPTT